MKKKGYQGQTNERCNIGRHSGNSDCHHQLGQTLGYAKNKGGKAQSKKLVPKVSRQKSWGLFTRHWGPVAAVTQSSESLEGLSQNTRALILLPETKSHSQFSISKRLRDSGGHPSWESVILRGLLWLHLSSKETSSNAEGDQEGPSLRAGCWAIHPAIQAPCEAAWRQVKSRGLCWADQGTALESARWEEAVIELWHLSPIGGMALVWAQMGKIGKFISES